MRFCYADMRGRSFTSQGFRCEKGLVVGVDGGQQMNVSCVPRTFLILIVCIERRNIVFFLIKIPQIMAPWASSYKRSAGPVVKYVYTSVVIRSINVYSTCYTYQ